MNPEKNMVYFLNSLRSNWRMACEVAKNPHILLTIANQHIQEINRKFDGTLNNYGAMVFSANKAQNYSYTFNEMLLQPDKSYLILSMIK